MQGGTKKTLTQRGFYFTLLSLEKIPGSGGEKLLIGKNKLCQPKLSYCEASEPKKPENI